MASQKSWATVKGSDETKRWEESVKLWEKKKGEFTRYRFLEAPTPAARHWVDFLDANGDKKGFYSPCFAFNSDKETPENDNACPACRAGIKASKFYATNVINRDTQENKPATVGAEKPNSKGFKEKSDKGWSPVEVLTLPAGQAKKIQNIISLNKWKINGTTVCKTIEDAVYGRDLEIMFDPSAEGAAMYDIQKGDATKLTPEELKYLKYDLSIIPNFLNSQKAGDLYYDEKMKLEKDLKKLGKMGSAATEEEDAFTEAEEIADEEVINDEATDVEETPAPKAKAPAAKPAVKAPAKAAAPAKKAPAPAAEVEEATVETEGGDEWGSDADVAAADEDWE
jgi:hypothetical protein